MIKLCSEYNFVGDTRSGDVHARLDNIEGKMLRPIFFCLSRSLKYLDVVGLQRLFWCAILLLQYFPEHYLSGPVLLLHEVIDELLLRSAQPPRSRPRSPHEGFTLRVDRKDDDTTSASMHTQDNMNITSSLLAIRQSDPCLKEVFDEIEGSALLGISFESSFSTALTSTLLRLFNVKDTKTKSLTIDMLQKLLRHDQATYPPPPPQTRGVTASSDNNLNSNESDENTRTEQSEDADNRKATPRSDDGGGGGGGCFCLCLERGVSGYAPILLPHLSLEESVVSRPVLSAMDESLGENNDVDSGLLGAGNEQGDPSTTTASVSMTSLSVTTTMSSVTPSGRRPAAISRSSSSSSISMGTSSANTSRILTNVSVNLTSSQAKVKPILPTYLAALSPSSAKAQQGVSPAFFGAHNFPTEKSIVLFVTSLLGYLRLLAQSVYSDEEQQSHSFAFVILLQVLREVPVALHKLYQVIFAELNTTYSLSVQRNHYLADIVLEAIHECLLSKPQVSVPLRDSQEVFDLEREVHMDMEDESDETDEDLLMKRKNITIKLRPSAAGSEAPPDKSFVGKLKSTLISDKDHKDKGVNVMREDVDFLSDNDEEEDTDSSSLGSRLTGEEPLHHSFHYPPSSLLHPPPRREMKHSASSHGGLCAQGEASDMACLAEVGFSALLCGPYSYNFTRCGVCEGGGAAAARTCPCYKDRLRKKELVSFPVQGYF